MSETTAVTAEVAVDPQPATYRLDVATYWPGARSPGDSGTEWEKPFGSPEEAWSAALDSRAWFNRFGREVTMWLYQNGELIKHAARR